MRRRRLAQRVADLESVDAAMRRIQASDLSRRVDVLEARSIIVGDPPAAVSVDPADIVPTTTPADLLTEEEHEAMHISGQLANLVRKITGDGDDWTEACQGIHQVQNMILSQAAARAYPDQCRLMGQSFKEGT